jgi:hypothetical protein
MSSAMKAFELTAVVTAKTRVWPTRSMIWPWSGIVAATATA